MSGPRGGEFPLADLLDYVGLARSTYYYRVSHPHVDRLADVRGLVRSVFEGSGGAYGYRRFAMALERDHGVNLDRKTVAKVMRQERPGAKGHRRRCHGSHEGTMGRVASEVMAHDFSSDRPMARLSGSGAVIHTDQGFQYQNPRWQAKLAAMGCT